MGDISGSLEGKCVVITGGGTGIGRATAHRFAAEGAQVLVTGRTAARLEEAAAAYPSISAFAADGAAADGPERIVEAAVRRLGRIDVLVNNAAITRPAALGTIDRRTAEEQIATNLLAPLFLAQAALPHLASARGTIVNVSSNPPSYGWPDNSVYGSTKVALDFLTATWAVELAPKGVRVVSVAPGITATPVMAHAGFTREQIAALGEGLTERIPLGRIAQPGEIAWWIVNVARPEAGYLTGTVVRVDGGLSVAAGQRT
ncbi:SDR family NAD(P)-dependent oxidoreductase [Nonomuraea jabiensis]|uniref:NAD(P)-dependent dehydrogenase (Short-subunit alcohol dehydrogenase family) n=1 Tax=Nonomuraea jabiensis TaxID=882448 RepID=A0A7W9GBZ1_9ACTN|nr:SDR family oxidoreductase [Nonomuraea jabiensis]MBB5780876.1 NAD(P)-dependent dehydrogenase (short-subunit alcohol dehydrogenase family) [Nonomuraea jabiensis]